MPTGVQGSLRNLLEREYPFVVTADPDDGGYVIEFPDLPGCVTQVDDIADVGAMAEEIRTLWIETAYELGIEIPLPSYPETYSGRFNVRLPKSLHRKLVERAEQEGVSLNQLVVSLLSAGLVESDLAHRIERLEDLLQREHSVA